MGECVCVHAHEQCGTPNGFRSYPFLHVQNIKVLKYIISLSLSLSLSLVCVSVVNVVAGGGNGGGGGADCCCLLVCSRYSSSNPSHPPNSCSTSFTIRFYSSSRFTFVMAFYCLKAKFSIEKFIFVRKNNDDDTLTLTSWANVPKMYACDECVHVCV